MKKYRVVFHPYDRGEQPEVVAEGKTRQDAEAIVEMAVMRRGVEHGFYREEEQPDGQA